MMFESTFYFLCNSILFDDDNLLGFVFLTLHTVFSIFALSCLIFSLNSGHILDRNSNSSFLNCRVKDAAAKCDRMFSSEKKLADILIKVSTSFAALGTRERTDLDK